jgi:metallo-beta-lactamase class B
MHSLTSAYESANLKIEQISKSTYVHITYLETKDYGKVACNGLILIDQEEAFVFDTPTEDSVSTELINWLEKTKKIRIKGVVINHFHVDCLGGLGAFHKKNIPSYANYLTIELAHTNNLDHLPLNGFKSEEKLYAGNKEIVNSYFGAGHTQDNIVSYLPSEKILFGGCLIKTLGAGKGNLADADINQWAVTVSKIKQRYPKLRWVIPGHGKPGGVDLLDYTIQLFSTQ